jgi:hypothetical protein
MSNKKAAPDKPWAAHQCGTKFELLLISLLTFRSVGVVVLNAGLNVIDRLLSEIQSLDAMSALISIGFLQFFGSFPQVLKSCLHVGLGLIVLSVNVSRSQRHQRNYDHDSEIG